MTLSYELKPYSGARDDYNYYQMVITDDRNRKASVNLAFFKLGEFDQELVQKSADETLGTVRQHWEQLVSARAQAH